MSNDQLKRQTLLTVYCSFVGFLISSQTLVEAESSAIVDRHDGTFQCAKDGFFRDPFNCSFFYRCADITGDARRYQMFQFDCPSGTVYDESVLSCNHPLNVDSCSTRRIGVGRRKKPTGIALPLSRPLAIQRVGASDHIPAVILSPELARQRCKRPGLFRSPDDCRRFFICVDVFGNKTLFQMCEYPCPDGTVFSGNLQLCVEPERAEPCTDVTLPPPIVIPVSPTPIPLPTPIPTPTPTPDGEDDFRCTQNGYFRHPTDCAKYYQCTNITENGHVYERHAFVCAAGTVFDESISVCNHPANVPGCENSVVVTPTPVVPTNPPTQPTRPTEPPTQPTRPTEPPTQPSRPPPTGSGYQCTTPGFFRDPNNCSIFYQCVNTSNPDQFIKHKFSCGVGSVFDESIKVCNHPDAVPGCGLLPVSPVTQLPTLPTRPPTPITLPTSSPTVITDTPVPPIITRPPPPIDKGPPCTRVGFFRDPSDCTKFYLCTNLTANQTVFQKTGFLCGAGSVFDESISVCNHPSNVPGCEHVRPTEVPPVTQGPLPVTPVTEPVPVTPVTEPVPVTPVTEPVPVTPVTPVTEPVPVTPVTEPVPVTPVTEPVPVTPVTPITEPVPVTPVTEPVPVTPVTEPVPVTPITEPVPVTPVTEPVPVTPVTEPVPVTPVTEPVPVTPLTEPVPVTPVTEPVPVTPVTEPVPVTPVTEPVPVTPVTEPVPVTPITEPVPVTPVTEPVPVTPVTEPVPVSPVTEPVPVSPVTEPVPVTQPPVPVTQPPVPITQKPLPPVGSLQCYREGFFGDPANCSVFYRCVSTAMNGSNFIRYEFSCGLGTVFDPSMNVCNYPNAVPGCGKDVVQPPPGGSVTYPPPVTRPTLMPTTGGWITVTQPTVTSLPPSLPSTGKPAVTISPGGSITITPLPPGGTGSVNRCTKDGFFRYPNDCGRFYRCIEVKDENNLIQSFKQIDFVCGSGTAFDETLLICNHPSTVPGCESYVQVTTPCSGLPSEGTHPTRPPTLPTQPPTLPTKPPTLPTQPPTLPTQPPTLPTRPPTLPTNPPTLPTRPPTLPSRPPTLPPTLPTRPPGPAPQCSKAGYFRNPTDCTRFYVCANLTEDQTIFQKTDFVCGPGTVFDESISVCNHPANVPGCGPITIGTLPPTIPTRPSTLPTRPPTLPTRPPTIPTRPPTLPTRPPTIPTRPPTLPTRPPTLPTRPPTLPTRPPTIPTRPPTIPTRPPPITSLPTPPCSRAGYFRNPLDCTHFYVCTNLTEDQTLFQKTEFACGEGSVFDESINVCNHPSNVPGCEHVTQQPITTSGIPGSSPSPPITPLPPVLTTAPSPVTQTQPPPLPPSACKAEGLLKNPQNCSRFIRCVDLTGNGTSFETIEFDCPIGTLFDETIHLCNHANLVKCTVGPPVITLPTSRPTSPWSSTISTVTWSSTAPTPQSTITPPPTSGQFTCIASGKFKHESDCTKFYLCQDLLGDERQFHKCEVVCPSGTVFDVLVGVCVVSAGPNLCAPAPQVSQPFSFYNQAPPHFLELIKSKSRLNAL